MPKKPWDKSREYDKEYYHRHTDHQMAAELDRLPSFRWIKEKLDPKTNETVLDAGCGTGHALQYYCSQGAIGIGVDFSKVAVAVAATTFYKQRFLLQDLTALAFRDEVFDKIACFNVLEHIEEQEQDKVMRELRRVLRRGGTIVIGTNIRDSLSWRLFQFFVGEHTHVKEFSVKEFIAFASRYFDEIEWCRSSCVSRLPRPLAWIFHYVLKGDILVRGTRRE